MNPNFLQRYGAAAFIIIAGLLGAALHVTPGQAQTITYTYDTSGRLLRATYADGSNMASRFLYDLANNRSTTDQRPAGPAAASIAFVLDGALGITILPSNLATDPQGSGLTFTSVGNASHGSAVINNGGQFLIYTRGTGTAGLSDNFSYTLRNSAGATINGAITISFPPKPPSTTSFSATAVPGQTVTLTPTINDPQGAAVTLIAISRPAYGTAAIVGNAIRYTAPATGVVDTIDYTVINAFNLTATARVTISSQSGSP